MPESASDYWVYIGISVLALSVLAYVLFATQRAEPTLHPDDLLNLRNARDAEPYFIKPARSTLPRDNLLVIRGLLPEAATRLDAFNVSRYDQIVRWDEAQIAGAEALLHLPRGYIAEARWIEQAKLLAEQRYEEYEAEFGPINLKDLHRFREGAV